MIALKNTTDKQIFYILKKSTSGFHPYFDLTSLSVEYTENGQYSILPPTGYDGLSKVNVTVDVAGSCNLTTSTATITEGGIHTITPPSGYDGFTEVTVDTSNVYDNGKQDGIDEQKSKLTSESFTENGTYNREDGWNAVTVNVDTQTPYDNGFADGEDAQKAKLSSLNVIANGTYSREDGWNEVTVDVSGGGSCNLETKSVTLDFVGPTEILPSSGYDGFSSVTVTCPTHIGGTADNPVDISNLEQVIEGRTWGQYDWLYFLTYITRWVEENNVITAIDDNGITYNMGSPQTIFSRYKNAGNNIADLKKGPRTFRIKPAGASYSIENDGDCYTGYVNNVYWDEFAGIGDKLDKMKSISTIGNQSTDEENLFFDLSYSEDPDEPIWTVNGANNLGVYDERGNKVSGFTGTYDGDNYTVTYTTDTQIPAGKYTIRYSNANNYLAYYCNESPEYPEKCLAEFYFDGEPIAQFWKTIRESYLCEDLSINPDNRIWFFTDDVDSITITWDGQQPTKSIKYVDCKVSLCPIGWDGEDVKQVQKHIDDTVTSGTYLNLHFESQLFPDKNRLQAAVDVFNGSGGMNLAISPTTRWAFIPYVDTSAVTNMNYMFYGMVNLETIPLLNTSNATSMAHMFDMTNPISGSPYMTIGQYDALPTLKYVPSINTSKVTSTAFMFNGCVNLGGIDYPRMSFDLSNCTTTEGMFKDCWYMLKVPNLTNTGNVTNWSRTFYMCGHYFGSVNTLTLDTSSATNMTEMFYGCENLQHLSELDCTNVVNVTRMFDGVFHLTEFGGCKNLGNAFGGTSAAAHTLDLSAALDADSTPTTAIHNVLSKLGTTTVSDAVVKFDAACYNLADPADIADATAKGWSVVSA